MSIGEGQRYPDDDDFGDAYGFKLWTAILTDSEMIGEYRTLWPARWDSLTSFVPMYSTVSGYRNFDYRRGKAWTESVVTSVDMPGGAPPMGVPRLTLGVAVVAAGGGTSAPQKIIMSRRSRMM
jgi:hypothetical protein